MDNFGGVPKQAFFAVYDGHGQIYVGSSTSLHSDLFLLTIGGRGCSEFCEAHLHLNLLRELVSSTEGCGVNVRDAMTSAYLRTDEQVCTRMCHTKFRLINSIRIFQLKIKEARLGFNCGTTAGRLSVLALYFLEKK